MARGARDDRTLDLLAWQPPTLAPRFDEAAVRSASLRGRIARAVATALRECRAPRDEIARRMGEYLGEAVSKAALDAYASEAREEHTISAVRLVALVHATGDTRLLQVLAEPFDQAVIPNRLLPAIEDALYDDKIAELQQRREIARRRWRGPRS